MLFFSVAGLENRDYGLRDPLRWPRDTFYPQRLALTSPTNGGRSVGRSSEIYLRYSINALTDHYS
jgi:hypothetical protein